MCIAAPKLWLLHQPKLEFLKLQHAIDILGWVICCVGEYLVYYRMVTDIPGLFPLHASLSSFLPYVTARNLQTAGQREDFRQSPPEFMSQGDGAEIPGRPNHL